MSTNPAYKELAYRKAILRHTINFLMSDVVGANGIPPKQSIVCEDVFDSDRDVDQDSILDFVEQLQEVEAEIKVEMSKFEFRKKDEQSQLAARLKTSRKGKRARGPKAPGK
jgi:hypothetical protein